MKAIIAHALRLALSFSWALSSWGCGGETPPPATPADDDRSQHAYQAPEVYQAPEDDRVDAEFVTIASRCNAVERSPNLPIACSIDVLENGVRMQLTMANQAAARQFVPAAFKAIGAPFCSLANRKSVPAEVVVALFDEQRMMVANCSDGKFSEWAQEDRSTRELRTAAQACAAVQESGYRVGCEMGIVDGRPSLVILFEKGAVDQSGWGWISQHIAAPFCNSTRTSGVDAVAYLIESAKGANRAKGILCTTGQETAWTGIQRVPQRKTTKGVPGRVAWNTIK